ncbi:PAS domain S-box protein [Oscillatoria laete-virens NRMC-F 0139]|nr:ATP-binding protein [Oscillatoria laete-virens]MDL5051985.1 PAS domain S-box protein [Oscillatoria laete-virens NRMC-F 0139]
MREDQIRARLAAIVDSSDDAIISKTLDGIITTWNKGAEKIFGYCETEVLGKSITILIPPDRLEEEPEILTRLRRGERVAHFETVRKRKDGKLVDISLTISPMFDDCGRIIGASKIARDITERKRIENDLKDERRVLEVLYRTGATVASELDLEKLVQSVTDSGKDLTGAEFGAFFYNVTNEKGEAFLLYALSGARKESFEKFGLPRNTPIFKPTFSGESIVRSADITKDPRYGTMAPHHGMPKGHLPVRSYLAAPVISRSGEVIGGLFFGHSTPGVFTERSEQLIVGLAAQAAIGIDNSRLYEELKRAAKERELLLEAEQGARMQAERTNVAKDQFLAVLSHELRTPINAVLGWSQILKKLEPGSADFLNGITVIERNARLQVQLIEDLLDVSKILSGKVRLDVQQVDLQEVMQAAVASLRHSAEVKGLKLQTILDPLAGPVRGDPARLQQCISNLLTNAIKFTPKGGTVQVSLARVNSHLEASVTDSGIGIKPEFLPYVFQRFSQQDASTTRAFGGLGIGLSIVKHLVELHGGTIRAKSAGEGKGSTFSIELPLMAVHTDLPEGRTHPASSLLIAESMDQPLLEGVSVLIVDDDADARSLVRHVLEERGALVFEAPSTEIGFSIVREKNRPSSLVTLACRARMGTSS